MGDAFNELCRQLSTGASAWKYPCRAVATSNITLGGEQTVDDVPLAAGERCLCVGQTNAKQNGIYEVAGAGWVRAVDLRENWQAFPGLVVPVKATSNFSIWQLNTPTVGPIRLDVDELEFTRILTSGIDVDGSGIAITSPASIALLAEGGGVTIAADGGSISLLANGASGVVNLFGGIALTVVSLTDADTTLASNIFSHRVPAGINATRNYTLPSTSGLEDGHRIRLVKVGVEAFVVNLKDPTGPTTIASISSGASGWIEAVKRSSDWRVDAWGGTVTGISTGV